MSESDLQRRKLVEMVLPAPTMTGHEVAIAAGIDFDVAETVWRALGMAHVEETVKAFSEWDVDTLKHVKTILELGYPLEELVTVARLMGRAMSRITDAHSRVIREALVEPIVQNSDDPSALDAVEPVITTMLDITSPILAYTYRRHLASAILQMPDAGHLENTEPMACGFADLVGFSKISDDLQEHELGALIAGFEEVVMETCIESRVRLVKIIGDSAMFVTVDPDAALSAARRIIEAVRDDDGLPDARAGLDWGPVLARGGDYFGRPVNVASRVTTFARPGALIVSRALLEELRSQVRTTRLTPRRLKNVGRVSLYRIDPPFSG